MDIRKALAQNDLIDVFAGTHSLLRVKFGQHINQRLCVHLIPPIQAVDRHAERQERQKR